MFARQERIAVELKLSYYFAHSHNFKSEIARIEHHLQVVFARKCRLHRKALLIVQQLLRNLKGLTASHDRGGGRNRGLDCSGYSIWIKDREGSKNVRIAVRQRALTGTICTGDEGKGRPIHRDVACAGRSCDFVCVAIRTLSSCFRSSATRTRAASAIFCASSIQ